MRSAAADIPILSPKLTESISLKRHVCICELSQAVTCFECMNIYNEDAIDMVDCLQ